MQVTQFRLALQPALPVSGELQRRALFRPETVLSFTIKPERNVSYAFGEGSGNKVLEFAMKSGVSLNSDNLIRKMVVNDWPAPVTDVGEMRDRDPAHREFIATGVF